MSETDSSEEVVFSTIVGKCPTCGGDAVQRSEFWEAAPENGKELESQISAIRKATENYYLALDRREHGVVAADKAFLRIQSVLGMGWRQGETAAKIEANPRLKPFYD